MPPAAAVIFDCDGTLVDSEPLARRAWEATLGAAGYAPLEEDFRAVLGLPYPRVHAHFAARAGLPGPEAFLPELTRVLSDLLAAELEPFADAVACVSALRRAGVPLAVASSSERVRLDRTLALAGLDGCFVATVAGDEVARGKPEPDLYLAAAGALGVRAGACTVVEDSPPGVAAGRAAGMRVIAVAREPGHAGGLRGADVVVRRLEPDLFSGPAA